MKRDDWPVGPHGVRPAGKPDECFYCHEKVGIQHKADCVIRSRTVIVELKMQIVMDVPEGWDAEAIEFKLNDSSSCQSNIIANLVELDERLHDVHNCPCGIIEAKYIREATEEDEIEQRMFVKDFPT